MELWERDVLAWKAVWGLWRGCEVYMRAVGGKALLWGAVGCCGKG